MICIACSIYQGHSGLPGETGPPGLEGIPVSLLLLQVYGLNVGSILNVKIKKTGMRLGDFIFSTTAMYYGHQTLSVI